MGREGRKSVTSFLFSCFFSVLFSEKEKRVGKRERKSATTCVEAAIIFLFIFILNINNRFVKHHIFYKT